MVTLFRRVGCYTVILLGLTAFGERLWAQPSQPVLASCRHLLTQMEQAACTQQTLATFIAQNLQYPDTARQAEIEGTVMVRFVIDTSGRVQQPALLSDIGYNCGDEALRVVRLLPPFAPATAHTAKTNDTLTIPIQFKLTDLKGVPSPAAYTVSWSNISHTQVTRAQLLAAGSAPLRVRDAEGNTVALTQLIFVAERKTQKKSVRSKGNITDAMRQLLKKLKPDDAFYLTAVIQEKGEFVYLTKSFIITK